MRICLYPHFLDLESRRLKTAFDLVGLSWVETLLLTT